MGDSRKRIRGKTWVPWLATGVLMLLAVLGIGRLTVATGTRFAPPAPLPLASELRDDGQKLRLSFVGCPEYPAGQADNWIERMLEERFNLEIEPTFFSGAAYQEKRPLIFASGAVPDLFWEGDPIQVQAAVRHGFAVEVPYEVICKFAPHYVERLNQFAPETWLYSYVDGKNYGIPTFWPDGACAMPGAWRQDWLDKLGIARIPETLDEMHAALSAIVHQDPDGNGKPDTLGMVCDMSTWFFSFSEIFGAHGVQAYSWMRRDGRVVWGGTLPETRQALALLRAWYAEGLIDPDFVSGYIFREARQKFLNGQAGYMPTLGMWHEQNPDPISGSAVTLMQKLHPEARVVPARFPRGPAGQSGAFVWGSGAHIWLFGPGVARQPEKLLRVLRMLDEMVTDDTLFLESRMGRRGIHWDFAEATRDAAGGIRILPSYVAAAGKLVLEPQLTRCAYYNPLGAWPAIADPLRTAAEVRHRRQYQDPRWGMRDVFLKPDVVPLAGEYLQDLRFLQTRMFAEIIRGDRPLADFDEFVRQWYRQGGERLTEEANRLDQVRGAIYRQVGVEVAP
jgi:putative aldouronate transport system substrate-binding protein